jgi:nucleotide-binding universal stress UspA family protein
MYNKILLPTDGSKASYDAAKHAIWAAKSCDAELIVLNVVESSKLPEMVPVEVEASLKKMLMEEGNTALDGVSELLDKEIKVSYTIKEGSPATIILQTIENKNVDLVVMGTSGKHRLDRLFMGSVAEKVVRNAKCAVTIIH